MSGGWAMGMGTHQTPKMDMRGHIKHQNTDMKIHINEIKENHKQTF